MSAPLLSSPVLGLLPALGSPDMSERVEVRPIAPWDTRELERFYGGLSPESRRTRFFALVKGISHGDSVAFCTPDHNHREGFVALTVIDGQERIVGHVCLEPVDGESVEIAIAVADAWQGRGIGRRLMEAAVDWARDAGFRRLTATMLTGNAAIHRLLSALGRPYGTRRASFDTDTIEIDLDARVPAAA